MLYKIQPALVNKVVGYIVSERMTEGYQYDSPNSVYNLKIRGKLDFAPDIDAIEILKRGKVMDIIDSVPVPRNGILLSDKLARIFLKNTVPMHMQIFDAYVVHKEKRHHFNYLYIYKSREDSYVDWKSSRFKRRPIGYPQPVGSAFELNLSVLKNKWNKSESIEPTHPSKLVLIKKNISSDIILLDYSYRGYFVSELLKNEIKKSGCQGVDFIPIDQLGFEVEFI